MSELVKGPSGRSRPSRENLGKVRAGAKNPLGVPGRVGGPLRRSKTGRWTLGEVQDGSGTHPKFWDLLGYPREGPGRVEEPSRRSGMGRGNHPEVWDW